MGLGGHMSAQADSKNLVVLDVRTPEEFAETHVKESVNLDFLNPSFMTEVAKLDKSKTYKVYCRSGNRSGQAERMMKTLGFKDVENIGSVAEAAQILKRSCEGKNS